MALCLTQQLGYPDLLYLFFFFFFFNEWEHRIGTLRLFSNLHPVRKGRGSQCQVIIIVIIIIIKKKKKLLECLKYEIVIYICRMS